jgi:tetratricopeptide (TPR) repeat protein
MIAALALLLALGQGALAADAARAELALKRGDRADARRLAQAVVASYEQDAARRSSADHVAAGRAYVILGDGDAEAVRAALAAFDAAVAADSQALEPRVLAGDLFLAKYNAPDARQSYESALRLAPDHPRALLGLARVMAFEGNPETLATVRRSLARDPALVDAWVFLAREHLEAEAYDSAARAAAQALLADSGAIGAWAVRGAIAWLRGDTTAFRRARAAATRVQPRPAEFYVDLAEAAARHRRYADAVRFGREAVALDPLSSVALGVLGTNELRIGTMDSGRVHLERAFARDPFHVWNKNMLDLLDELRGFRTLRSGRFEIVAPAAEAELLALYLGPLLDSGYTILAARYDHRPAAVRFELYRRHADFSVRTVGLAGLGALGVSFGAVLAMDAPSARERGSFNWGSTAWHELAHTFTLGRSAHRVPRWFSEGLSVLEERRAHPSWGADMLPEYLELLGRDRWRPVSRLNEGFVRPSHPGEIQLSYYQASLVCEMIEQRWGAAALPAMLAAFGAGQDLASAVSGVLRVPLDSLDRLFDGWVRARFAEPLRSVTSGAFRAALDSGRALFARGRRDAARRSLERAQQLMPAYAGEDGPAWWLAQLDTAAGNLPAAVAQLVRITSRNETALEANQLEADLRQRLGDERGAAAALERIIWMWPYDAATHRRLAEIAERSGRLAIALRERRAVIATRPADLLDARYELARVLALAGDRPGARREVLAVLEQAPGFEKAQLLLLDLQQDGGKKP